MVDATKRNEQELKEHVGWRHLRITFAENGETYMNVEDQ